MASLLHQIQSALIEPGTDIGPILLKLRLLAARLGSAPLEEWVKHESEGYPLDASVPRYRIIGVSYRATFWGPLGASITDVPVPPFLIEKFAGEGWNQRQVREGISAIDDLVRSATSGTLSVSASDLALLLQGKMYPDYTCGAVIGTIPRAFFVELQHAVRSKILELTIGLEKDVPTAAEITFNDSVNKTPVNSERVTQVTHQTVYGNVTSISSSGASTTIHFSVQQGNQTSLVDALVHAGIPEPDAAEFGQIVASEVPESKQEPFGPKAKNWLVENLKKAGIGTWKIGVSVATDVLKQAALKYYGLS